MHDYRSIAETSASHLRDCTTLTQLRRRVATLNNTRLPTEGPVARSVARYSFRIQRTRATTCLGLRSYPAPKRHSSSLTSSGLTCMNFHRSYLARFNAVFPVRLARCVRLSSLVVISRDYGFCAIFYHDDQRFLPIR